MGRDVVLAEGDEEGEERNAATAQRPSRVAVDRQVAVLRREDLRLVSGSEAIAWMHCVIVVGIVGLAVAALTMMTRKMKTKTTSDREKNNNNTRCLAIS